MAVDSVNLSELLVMSMKKTCAMYSYPSALLNDYIGYNTGFCYTIQPNQQLVIPEKIKNCELLVLICDVRRLRGFSYGITPTDMRRLVCSPCKYNCRHSAPDYEMYRFDKLKINQTRLFPFSKGSCPLDEQIIFVSMNGKQPPKPSAVFNLLQPINRFTTLHIWQKMKNAWIWKINPDSTCHTEYVDEVTRLRREALVEQDYDTTEDTTLPPDTVPKRIALCVLELEYKQTSPLPHETNLNMPPTTKNIPGYKLNLRRII